MQGALERHASAIAIAAAASQRREHRRDADRVDHDQKGHEDGNELIQHGGRRGARRQATTGAARSGHSPSGPESA
jgi:hypothetical protein